MNLTELLSAATAAGEAERARYVHGKWNNPDYSVCERGVGICGTAGAALFRGTEADCQRYIAERGNRAVFAYLAEHVCALQLPVGNEMITLDAESGVRISAMMRFIAGAGEGGNDDN